MTNIAQNLIDQYKNHEIGLHSILDSEYLVEVIKKLLDDKLLSKTTLLTALSANLNTLNNPKLFEELIESNSLNKDDLRYFLNTVDEDYELVKLSNNTSLLKYIVDKDIVSFKELVDKFKSFKNGNNDPCLYRLLGNKEFFKELIESNILNKEDTRYLLNRIDNGSELRGFCKNTPLIKYILNEFVLNKETVDKLNRIVKNDKWRKDPNIQTIFDRIEYWNKNNEEVLKLNELNKYVYNFDEDQKLELIELLRSSEVALNRLIEIVDNHLESNYNFESLMNCLKKKEKRNILNI